MRPAIYVAFVVAVAAVAPGLLSAAAASAASVVLESLPYLALGSLLHALAGRHGRLVSALAGCGCDGGPGARSLPATLAAALLFGLPVALARWLAAMLVSRLRAGVHESHGNAPLLGELRTLLPSAIVCGAVVTLAPFLDLAHRPAGVQLAAGIALGFAGAPCALGGVALAAALRAQSPLASAAVLAISGIVDLRALLPPRHAGTVADGASYALFACACAFVAARHGDALVHPRLMVPLICAGTYCAWLALRSRWETGSPTRRTACALIVVCVLGAPPPPRIATAATIDDAYPGERVDFTGRYVQDADGARVVRYAITCCRADARPVGVCLAREAPALRDQWVRVRGTLRWRGTRLVLDGARIARVDPPGDPFIYR